VRLTPVPEKPYFRILCIRCLKTSYSDRPHFADLDGEPFKAYYCADCAYSIAGVRTTTEGKS
jgi:hypothetical protein